MVNAISEDYLTPDCLVHQYHSKKILKSVIADFQQSETCHQLILYDKSIKKLFENFISLYKIIIAAGGLVRNKKGEILFIFRNGKWDLPKGKKEKNEALKNAAIREVSEECGIKKLVITRILKPTYHLYELKGKNTIKKSYWYEMFTTDNAKPVPQTREGITEVKWMSSAKVIKILDNAYLSVKELVTDYLKNL